MKTIKLFKLFFALLLFLPAAAIGADLAESKEPVPEASSPCAICQEPANKKCGKCRSVRYCSAAHQKEHWAIHKAACKAPVVEVLPFSEALMRQVYPGSASDPDANKLYAMRVGQENAYGYVRLKFGPTNDLFLHRFLTKTDIKAINKSLLNFFNDDGTPPDMIGAYRNQMAFAYRKNDGFMSVAMNNAKFTCETPSDEIQKDPNQLREYLEKNKTRAWLVDQNGELALNVSFIAKATAQEKKGAVQWTKAHLHIFAPHDSNSLIENFVSVEQSALQAPDGSPIAQALEQILDAYLLDIKTKINAAQGRPADIVKVAADAHMGLIRIHPFHGGHKRTARVVMNTILHYSGLKTVWFADSDTYASAIMNDLRDGGYQNFLKLLNAQF